MKVLITTIPFGGKKKELLKILDKENIQYFINPYDRKITEKELQDLIYDYDFLIAGTEPITKNVLNIITTVSMIKLEKVYKNLMIDILPTTKKLRARSIRNLCLLLDINKKLSGSLLEDSRWSIRVAVIIYKMNISYKKAKSLSKKISIVELLDAK